jgi:hypothetical protein
MPPKKKFSKKIKGKLRDPSPADESFRSHGFPGSSNFAPFDNGNSVLSNNKKMMLFSGEPCDSLYMRYKRATRHFKQALENLVPVGIYADTLVGLLNAADYVAEHLTAVEKPILDDLKLAIRVRKLVTSSGYYGADGDDEHSRFIAALDYCWARLCPLVRKTSRRTPPAAEAVKTADKDTTTENKFAALAVKEDDSDDDDDDDDDDLPSAKAVRPALDEKSHTMTLEELSQSEDRVDAIIFLMTMDELMGHNATHFLKLKATYSRGRGVGSSQPATAAVIQPLMEAATAVNFSIHQVSMMEHELAAQHEHLNTVYRVIAVVVIPVVVHDICVLVRCVSPRAQDFREADATAFAGDALECTFHLSDDLENHLENQFKALDDAFCSRWQLGKDDLRAVGIDAARIAFMGQPWLPTAAFIGGTDRRITHTIRILQSISDLSVNLAGLPLLPGVFGAPWDESRNKANGIAEDLDSVLMGEILPHLLAMCMDGVLSFSLPYENELLPLFVELRNFYKNPRKPISWNLAFGVHAVLTSIIEVQGDDCVRGLGEIAKATFQTFFRQLPNCHDQTAKDWGRRMEFMQAFRWLVVTPREGTPESEYIALWNPLCAGTFLCYQAYAVNITFGCGIINSCSQLRMVLHLFNGLVKHGLVTPGELPILDMLYSRFADCKAVWGGSLPERGELVKRWWIAYGMKINWSLRKTEETKIKWAQNGFGPSVNVKSDSTRQRALIKAEDLSQSFRRICLRDFTGVVDTHHSAQQKRDGKGTILYEHVVRVNDTLDWMKADQVLLATNLTCVGALLRQFVKSLSVHLEWQPLIEHFARETPLARHRFRSAKARGEAFDERMELGTVSHLAASVIFGALDFRPDAVQLEGSDIAKTVVFTKAFFSQVDVSSLMWYAPPPEDD